MLTAAVRFSGHATGRVLSLLLAILVGTVLGLVTAAGAVAWRLSQGPVDITGLVNRYAPVFQPGLSVAQAAMVMGRQDGRHIVSLTVTGLALAPSGDNPAGQISQASVSLAVLPLFAGQIEPRDVAVSGADLQLALGDQGASQSPLGPALDRAMAGLRRVRADHVSVTLSGAAAGPPVRMMVRTVALDRDAGGVLSGQADATAAAGNLSADLHVAAAYGSSGATLFASLSPLSPAALARAVPDLAPLAALDAPVALRGSARFGPGLRFLDGAVHADAGAGTVQLPAKGAGAATAQFAGFTLDADGTPAALTLRALHLTVASPSGAPPVKIVIGGRADRAGGRITAHLAVDLDQVLLADVPAIWPPGVGGQSRDWLTQNLTAGRAHDGHITFTLASAEDGSDLDLTEAGGTLTGDDTTVWWLRPVPPLQHAHALVVWQSPDVMTITATGARQGAITATNSSIRITGLTVDHQFGVITTDLGGPLGDVITLLKHPRLELLSKRPVTFDKAAGAVAAHMTVNIPLEDKVTIDQIAIHVKGQVADTHLGGIAAGRDIDGGQLAFDVNNEGMTIAGPAQLGHIPGQLNVQLDFRDGPKTQVLLHATAALTANPAAARAAGLSALGLEAGSMPVTIDYAERRDDTASVKVAMDLTGAGFTSPFGWSKQVGTAGSAGGQGLLNHGDLVGLDGLQAQAPGLSIMAKSDMIGGYPAVVHLQKAEIGRSSATGVVALPQKEGDPYRVTLSGPQLDLEGRLKSDPAPAAKQDPPPSHGGAPYVIDLHFDRVMLGPEHGLTAVALTASGTGRRLTAARLTTGGETRVRAELVTAGQRRRLTATAADLGRLLRDADLARELDGGELSLTGEFDDREPAAPFNGTIDLRSFRVQGAPFAAKLLQALTIYGIGDAMKGPGLAFDRLDGQFRLAGDVLSIDNARAFSSSLGVTATGRFDFGGQTVNLHGTIVPAYFFNSLPGRMPWLGRLFSPEKGSGLFAANFSMVGPVADPAVSVNPLSALTPGFMRRLFNLF